MVQSGILLLINFGGEGGGDGGEGTVFKLKFWNPRKFWKDPL